MTVEQIVEIPADYQISLTLPRSIPVGVKARIAISIPSMSAESKKEPVSLQTVEIEDVRLSLRQEMIKKGTLEVTTASGDGWEAHVRERYAEL
jgi:hypothetical protein